MEKTMLVAGKDMPAGSKFADGVAFTGRNMVVTGSESDALTAVSAETEAVDEQTQKIQVAKGLSTAEWNRNSSLSARTLVLQAENAFDKLDEAVLFFDEDYFATLAGKMDASECSRNSDELISGFQYLTLEVLARFEKKNAGGVPGKLVFLIKEGPSMLDALRSPLLRNGSNAIATPLVAAAAGAFTSFAENIAAVYGDMEYVNIVLVRGDKSMETVKSDDALGKWLGSYLDAVDAMKGKLTAKKSIQWVRPGTKSPRGFSFFN